MSPKQRHQFKLADWVVIGISPALIMVLVGSLVFFLVEVLYVGEHGSRMRWILSWFVFGSVLIGRMSMETHTADRHWLYGLVLGGLVWVGLELYVEYAPSGPVAAVGSLVNVFFVAVTWWSAHRLVWDCTHIDDDVDASGEGLLQTAGLDAPAKPEEPAKDKAPKRMDKKSKAKDEEHQGLLGWMERYRRYREEKKRRPHNPCVWVVYFSLAALPLFGLGQSLIPVGDVERRQNAFWYMVLYVASGLGLLLTTCFLGLRRYLRQRNLQMPLSMTGVWLTTGGALVAVFLLFGALLPRPYPEYSLLDPSKLLGSPDRQASKYAKSDDDAGKGEGRAGSKQSEDDKQGSPGSRTKPGSQGKDGKGGQGKSGKDGSGKSRGKDKSSSSQKGDQQREEGGKDAGKGGDDKKDPSDAEKRDADSNGGGRPDDNKKDGQSNRSGGTARAPSRVMNLTKFFSMHGGITNVIKWIVYILFGLFVLWGLLKFLANFTNWARRLLTMLQSLWRSLFGWMGGGEARRAEPETAEEVRRPRPFSAFRNPFWGDADGRSPEELVRYSFEALEAYAYERDLARRPDETPLEFADRLGEELPGLQAETRRLAVLYARMAYARGRLPSATLESLQQFWQALEAVGQPSLAGDEGD